MDQKDPPYICDFCKIKDDKPYSTKRKPDWDKHIKTYKHIVLSNKGIECPFCKKIIKNIQTLRQHDTDVHTNRYSKKKDSDNTMNNQDSEKSKRICSNKINFNTFVHSDPLNVYNFNVFTHLSNNNSYYKHVPQILFHNTDLKTYFLQEIKKYSHQIKLEQEKKDGEVIPKIKTIYLHGYQKHYLYDIFKQYLLYSKPIGDELETIKLFINTHNKFDYESHENISNTSNSSNNSNKSQSDNNSNLSVSSNQSNNSSDDSQIKDINIDEKLTQIENMQNELVENANEYIKNSLSTKTIDNNKPSPNYNSAKKLIKKQSDNKSSYSKNQIKLKQSDDSFYDNSSDKSIDLDLGKPLLHEKFTDIYPCDFCPNKNPQVCFVYNKHCYCKKNDCNSRFKTYTKNNKPINNYKIYHELDVIDLIIKNQNNIQYAIANSVRKSKLKNGFLKSN
jgi:hypothetical protein